MFEGRLANAGGRQTAADGARPFVTRRRRHHRALKT